MGSTFRIGTLTWPAAASSPWGPSTLISSSTAIGTFSVIVNKPSGVVAGNILLAFCYNADFSATQWAVPAGWVQQETQLIGGVEGNGLLATKIATSSEPATYEFDNAPPAILAVVLNYGSVSSVDVHTITGSNTAVTSCTVPSLTPAVANEIFVCGFGSFTGQAFTTPTGLTQQAALTNGSTGSLYVFDGLWHPSTATGTITSTQSGSTGYIGADILLHP